MTIDEHGTSNGQVLPSAKKVPAVTKESKDELTVEAVVKLLGITPRTLHYYEEVGLISPVSRTVGGHRLFSSATIARIEQIIRLKDDLGYSLQEIRQVLEAEQSLVDLRQQYHQDGLTQAQRSEVMARYSELLRELIGKMSTKVERLSIMRDAYQARLARVMELQSEIRQE